ncbi:hypothetical protein Bhyg_01329 [Pseudolycoriella hygida]|uniref:Uncharacterized protein n=1 Tax=Pseudolycoriella hygida TaxID=35572 RepID=A0A9Q0S5Q7_9DIPT|nr:hypothetical protein Bhyg_01329 [Pseudolycoriella hygida]
MGKRKADDQLERCESNRCIRYDIQLLKEVEQFNPFAFKNQEPIWENIVEALRDSPIPMNVTSRSCRERVTELLQYYRKGEMLSIPICGIAEEHRTALQVLLTDISKLEETRPSHTLKSLCTSKDHEEAEDVRDRALDEIDADSDIVISYTSDDEFEFGPNRGRSGRRSTPKNDLVKFLENKNAMDLELRREELRIREEELRVKNKEIEINQLKVEAEIEERKKMMDLLVKLVSSAGPAQ